VAEDLVAAGGEADDAADLFVDVSLIAHLSHNDTGFGAVHGLLGQSDIAEWVAFVIGGQSRQQFGFESGQVHARSQVL